MNKNKAFIFDMDGVIINSELAWLKHGGDFEDRLFGKEVFAKIGDTVGLTVDLVYEKAQQHGFFMDKTEYYRVYDEHAFRMYNLSQITPNIDRLVEYLLKNKFKLGLVSSSRYSWIKKVLEKTSFQNKLDCIFSINDEKYLSKPHPDGYIEAFKKLGALPRNSVVLEDSNSGIKAAKAAGAYVIGFRAHLLPRYKQIGADVYAGTIEDVIKHVETFMSKHD